MIRPLLLAGAAAIALASPALALVEPKPGPRDPRMRTVEWHADEVYRFVGTMRSTVQITVPRGETWVGGASGDSLAWEIFPADEKGGNVFVAKPRAARGGLPTTIQITTRDQDGDLKTYQFEAVAREGSIAACTGPNRRPAPTDDPDCGDVMLSVTFIDRERIRREAAAKAEQRRAELASRQVQERLEVAHYYGTRNWSYSATQGLLRMGLEVSDNRVQTMFRFPGNLAIPAIFLVAPDGSEQRVQTIVRGEVVVVPMTAPLWRLRLDSLVLDVRNDGWDPIGVNYGTGTSSPDVTLEPRPAPRNPVRRVSR